MSIRQHKLNFYLVEDNIKHNIKQKRMGVIFKNLTVIGEGADATQIPNLWTPIESFISYLNPLKWYFYLILFLRVGDINSS